MSVQMRQVAELSIRKARVVSVRKVHTDDKGVERSQFEWKPPTATTGRLRRLPAESMLLLTAMADVIDNGADYWGGDEKLADRLGFSEAWVRKWRKPLIAAGVIELKEPARRDGNFESGGRRAHWLLFPWLHDEDGTPPWHE